MSRNHPGFYDIWEIRRKRTFEIWWNVADIVKMAAGSRDCNISINKPIKCGAFCVVCRLHRQMKKLWLRLPLGKHWNDSCHHYRFTLAFRIVVVFIIIGIIIIIDIVISIDVIVISVSISSRGYLRDLTYAPSVHHPCRYDDHQHHCYCRRRRRCDQGA